MCNISGAGRAGRVTFVKKLIVHPKKKYTELSNFNLN